MTADWTDAPVFAAVERLTPVPLDLRAAIKAGPSDKATHAHQFDAMPVLRQIEIGGAPPRRAAIDGPARVVFWNVERLRHLDAIAGTLTALAPDIMLLCEIDRGMARSGNTDRVRDLAERLGAGYAYAVEFVELDLGDVHEKKTHAGEVNNDGLHGAANLSQVEMRRPFLIRIDRRGDWFDGSRHEPRVGGTIALGAEVEISGQPVLVVNTHLESHDDPQARAGDMRRLLSLIEQVSRGGPVIIGGDFNTSTASRSERHDDPAAWRAVLAADPMRLLRPQRFEPCFDVAAEFGYDTSGCNVPDAPTTRYPAGSDRPLAKIDWFFTRHLDSRDPAVIAAVRPDGTPSTDHEGLLVTIDVRRQGSVEP